MTDITEILKKILTSVYGKDMRQAIHDGIAGCDENIKAECSNREKAEQEFATEIQNLEKKEKESSTKIQDLENQLTKSIQNLEDKIAIVTAGIFETVEAATINALKDYRWYKHPTTSMLTSMPASPSRGYYYQNTKISATPGSTYRITVYVMNAEQDTENIIAVASGSGTDSSYSDFLGLDVTLEEGMHDYYVTIPQGYNLLLVTTENYVAGNITISKLRL